MNKNILARPIKNSRHWILIFCWLFIFIGVPFKISAAEVELLSNRGFESGVSSFWSRNGDSGIFQGTYPHTPGTWYGFIGNSNNAIGSIHQFINIPSNASSATLTFYLNLVTFETDAILDDDKLDINFRHATTDALLKKWKTYTEADKGNNTAGQYVLKTVAISATDLAPYKGQSVLLQFYGTTDFADSTIFRIDDLSFKVTTSDTPSPPSTLAASGGPSLIGLGWNDNSSNEDGFKVERSTNGGSSWSQIGTTGVNEAGYSDASVSQCITYTYRVRAYNGVGNSPYSNLAADSVHHTPAAPNNLAATPSANSIGLTWTDNACDEDGFRLHRKTGASGTYGQLGNDLPNNTVGITDDSALSGVEYYYKVRAFNATGNSAYSSEVSARRSQIYTVGVSPGPNGTVAPNGNVSVNSGGNLNLIASPANNYLVDSWLLDGISAQTGGNSYTLMNVTENHTVLVTFKLKTLQVEIGGSLDGVQVFIDGNQTVTTAFYNLIYGSFITVRKSLQSSSQFVDYWSVVNQNGSQNYSGMALTTPIFSATLLQAILGNRNPNPQTGGTISGGTPVLLVPSSGTTSTEVKRHVQRSHDLVCWRDYDLDPASSQVPVNGGPCSFGASDHDTEFYRTLFDVTVHAEPVLLFPIPDRSATTVRVTSLLDHCNEDALTRWPSDKSPNSDWYLNGVIGGPYHKDKMFMTYKGEVLCEENSLVENVPGFLNLWQFTKTAPLSRNLEFNWDYNGNAAIAYSGHPGYDFSVSDVLDNGNPADNVIVVACEGGTVIPTLSGSFENRIFIEHEHLGLATAYLHMKKWSYKIFDHNDVNSPKFYYAKQVRVEKGDILGLVGGAGKKSGMMDLTTFNRHLHMELYRIVEQEGRKFYVLMDPYGAYTETGKKVYGTSWLPSVTGAKAYQADYYRP